MAKSKYKKKKQKSKLIDRLFLIILIVLFLVIFGPTLITAESGLLGWFVNLLLSIQLHVKDLWMFYSFILAIFLAYYFNSKK